MSSETDAIIDWLASVADDPLAYVMGCFPWGEPGSRLEAENGPEDWQRDILLRVKLGILDLNRAVQEAVSSGHGVGKSALVAWLIKWGVDTKTDTRGVVTANTETQLKTKTWAELGKWHHMSLTKEIFKLTATAYFHPDRERTWRLDMVPWSERNTEAFAGMHNKGRRILVIFDEASAIPDAIWETTEGALTDAETEIIWCVFGNPTRNTGRFKDCFPGGAHAVTWHTKQVDSRQISFTNKDQIARWIKAYGEDSDFVRIRVYGQFPRVGEMEFFSSEEIAEAMSRETVPAPHDPLALGVDVARYGKNASVLFFRKGRDARTIPRQRYQGLSTVQLADKVFEAHTEFHPDGIFIDGGGVGGGVVDNVRQKQLFCYEVQFGSRDDTPHAVWGSAGEKYANKRTGMYGAARAWVRTGCLPNEPGLRKQFMAIKYVLNKKDEIQLIAKEDMLKLEPDLELDDIDAFVETFAHALAPHARAGGQDAPLPPQVETEYDPLSAFHKEMAA